MRHKMRDSVIAGTALISLLAWSPAIQAGNISSFRFGADERVRQEYFDHVPSKVDSAAYARGGENNYLRFRTRVWAEQALGSNVAVHVRAVNESRSWFTPDVSQRPQKSTSEWPDEWVLDNLYLDVLNLFDHSLDLRIGRQELIYGNGRIIMEGTPGDGTRTFYFNAAKATWKAIPKTTIDLFGIYNEPEDDLAINPADRDLSAFSRSKEGVTESGAGLYLKNASAPQLPFEAYLIYKQEEAWDQAAKTNASGFVPPQYAWQTLDPDRKVVENPSFDVETAGFRLMPIFSEQLSGNLEAAFQYGQRGDEEMTGYMVDAYLTQTFKAAPAQPVLKGGVYCLSGDDPDTDADEGWNPLWARHPQGSDLYLFAWDAEESAFRWSNVIDPSVSLSLTPARRIKTTATLHYLMAIEDDGNGSGKERGWLGVLKNEFVLAENRWLSKDKLSTFIQLEVMEPGNYYKNDDTAIFARWELMYAF
jgi:hypothetical protein